MSDSLWFQQIQLNHANIQCNSWLTNSDTVPPQAAVDTVTPVSYEDILRQNVSIFQVPISLQTLFTGSWGTDLDSCWEELWQALGKPWLTPKLSDSLKKLDNKLKLLKEKGNWATWWVWSRVRQLGLSKISCSQRERRWRSLAAQKSLYGIIWKLRKRSSSL